MTSTPGNVLLGTSGWSYKEWIGPFYSKTDKSLLRAYTHVFKTVEIDSTFYRYPSKGTVMGWARYSPEGFVYATKLPGLITHEKRLDLTKGVEHDLQRFIEIMEPLWLGGKLACILIQLPPKFDYRPKELEDFFKLLPANIRFAVEFRDLSWMREETWDMLESYKVAYTIVDEPLLPPEIHLTSDIAYFRWHGQGTRPWYNYRYSLQELEPWAPKVRDAAHKAKKVYGYFNNHYHGHAVENCLQVMEMLGNIDARQLEAKTKAENYFKNMTRAKDSTLLTFVRPRDTTFESLMQYFATSTRLERARQIKEEELKITSQTDTRVEASIRDYHIIVNADDKEILHNCADWEKLMPTKKLCKHLAKLLLSMDKEKARKLLYEIFEKEETWQFKFYREP